MTPLRLLILADEIFPDAIGGVAKSLYNEAAALVQRGHHVTVIIRASNPALPANETIAGIEVRRIQGPPRTSKLYYLFPLVMLVNVVRTLRDLCEPFDLVMSYHAIFLIAAHLSGITRRLPSIEVFYSSITQEVSVNRGKYGSLTPLARAAAWALGTGERWGLRRVSLILTRSRFSQDILRQWVPGATIADEIIPIGLNLTLYQPLDSAQARQQLDLPPDRPIVITARRLVARTGLENLLRAMALLREKGIDALLLIAGKGYLQPELERLIAELDLSACVRLLGFVPEESLPVYLAAADLFVLPTETLEGFGLATIEALAVGLPVVGTPVGATPEILRQIDPALLADSPSSQSLAHSLVRWLTDDAGRLALRQRSRAVIEANYQDTLVAEQLERLILRCISDKKRPQ